MRKGDQGNRSAPQAFASHDSSVQLKNAHAGSVWLVSHHQPASEAAYNRDAYVGQQCGFATGGPGKRERGHMCPLSALSYRGGAGGGSSRLVGVPTTGGGPGGGGGPGEPASADGRYRNGRRWYLLVVLNSS